MSGQQVFYLAALVFFVLGALPMPSRGVNWTNAGYAALTASLLV